MTEPPSSYFEQLSSSAEGLAEALSFHTLFSVTGLWVFFLIFISWILSYIIGWGVLKFTSYCCKSCVKKNDKRLYYLDIRHDTYINEAPWCVKGITKSRIKFYELMSGWVIFTFMTIGILWAYQLMLIMMGTPFGIFFAYMMYRHNNMSTLITSFIGRFRILWGDLIRVGEMIGFKEEGLKEDTLFKVIGIGMLNIDVVRMKDNSGNGSIWLEPSNHTNYSYVKSKPIPTYMIFIPDKITLYPNINIGNKHKSLV